MKPRLHLASLAAALVLVIAGCGGDGGGSAAEGGGGLDVVPASAVAYISLNSDLESGQWETLREHVDKFPDAGRLVDELLSELADEGVDWERDVEPALGPEVTIVALNADDDAEPEPVLLTQPDDEAKLDALMDRADDESPSVRREVEGWQAVAEEAGHLDAYATALEQGKLADDETFGEATADLPDESLMTVYVDGDAFRDAAREAGQPDEIPGLGELRWISGAAEAVGQGIRFAGTYNATGLDEFEEYTPTLLDRVPADALVAASFKGATLQLDALREQSDLGAAAGQVEQFLGVTLDELADLFRDEGAFYVRAAAPIPEVTLYVRVDDAAGAEQTLDRLAGRLVSAFGAQRGETTLDGDPATYLDARGLRVTYGVSDGVVTVTTSRALTRPEAEDRLSESGAFGAAKDASGLGDETAGFLYVDLERTVSLIGGFAGVAGEEVPPELERNVRPLESFVSHATRDGDEIGFVALLSVD